MANKSGSSTAYLLPGMKAKLTAPGFWVGTADRKKILPSGDYIAVTLINGFVVDNPDIGSIEEGETPNSVIYTHKKFAPNKVFFYANTGEVGELHIISVPIHDHSSIITGGPAYGTYFTDDETVDGGGS
jgi:hypothetical protein